MNEKKIGGQRETNRQENRGIATREGIWLESPQGREEERRAVKDPESEWRASLRKRKPLSSHFGVQGLDLWFWAFVITRFLNTDCGAETNELINTDTSGQNWPHVQRKKNAIPETVSNPIWVHYGRSNQNNSLRLWSTHPTQLFAQVAPGQVLSNSNIRRNYFSISVCDNSEAQHSLLIYFWLLFTLTILLHDFSMETTRRPHFHYTGMACHSWQGTVGVAEVG